MGIAARQVSLISMVPQEFKVPFFDNSLGFLITFIAIVIGGYFFVYLPKQTEIKHKRMGDYGNENTAQGLKNAAVGQGVEKTASIMSPPSSSLAPPKDDPISPSELAKYNGSNPSLPIYLAIKGTVFDVTAKKEMYGPGGSYNIFAGKDGSVGLGKSSLKPEDAVPDYKTLQPAEMKTLDQWYDFFSKRYNVV